MEEISNINCETRTYGELKETLEITLREALEFNRQEALKVAGSDYKEEKIGP